MIASSYTDAADNTTFRAHCEVAFYAVTFMACGVIASVSEHQTTGPARTDMWLVTPDTGERVNRTFSNAK